jgi:hypothetical protein
MCKKYAFARLFEDVAVYAVLTAFHAVRFSIKADMLFIVYEIN